MELTFNHTREFSKLLQTDISNFTETQGLRFPLQETLRMDLHCHDYNSDVPDEILGRILNVPETWTPTETVLKTLQQNGCNAFTITNHNNARSCYELQNKGVDILTGAEFSCTVPDFKIGIHVLAYGFTPAQETMLNKLRKNVYAFQEYAVSHDIPTVWAHPLYHYSPKHIPDMAFFNKMSLVFERFEVINGQRDTWQNLLVKSWIESLTPTVLESNAYHAGIKPSDFCNHPYKKYMTGGSDSHMGIFTGQSGTYLHVPDLEERKKSLPVSQLALEAIKKGQMAPYGSHNNNEKLNIAFLDYVCQIAINHKDPGLLRLLLHQGTAQEKMLALFITNAFAELQQHKTTMKFVELFHQSFVGVVPGNLKRMLIKKPYKPVFDEALKIAHAKKNQPTQAAAIYTRSVQNISDELNSLLWARAEKKIEKLKLAYDFTGLSFDQILKDFELPADLRTYLTKSNSSDKKDKNSANKSKFLKTLDGLSFPFLASGMLLAANFTSIKVLYNARPMLNNFSEHLQKYKHPKRMLWLTDTFEDKNGVSMVLKSVLRHIQQHDLPIDLLVCSDHLTSEKNLIVVKPDATFTLPFYSQQPVRIPNINKINAIFKEGEYDRVMTSTELPMGLVAQFLKHAYHVPAYFYLHTDWMLFGKKVLHLEKPSLERLKRLLRSFYQMFDVVFVLNKDQQNWLSGEQMKIDKGKLKMTAHWVDDIYQTARNHEIKNTLPSNQPTVIYAGRLSKEKGVMELPEIIGKIKGTHPNLKVIIAGSGPEEDSLKQLLPDASFMGWMEQKQLVDLYSSADLLLLPSRFDTFSCVVLEAMSCGLPVIAYNNKGPKDIITDGKNGFLADTKEGFSKKTISYLSQTELHKKIRQAARLRSKEYDATTIMNQLLTDIQLISPSRP